MTPYERHETAKNSLELLKSVRRELLNLKQEFLLAAQARGPYKLPGSLHTGRLNVPDFCLAYTGKTTVTIRSNNQKKLPFTVDYCFSGGALPKHQWSVELEDLNVYERNLFGTWAYTSGQLLVGNHWEPARWHFSDCPWSDRASMINENLVPKLMTNKCRRDLCDQIRHVVMNGQPQWHPGEVQWTFIRDLDEVIQSTKEEISHIQGSAFDSQPQQLDSPNTENLDLTDTEKIILEALGDETLTGPRLLSKAGYDNSSHYRTTLSNLKKRAILSHDGKGYARCHDSCQ